LYTAHTMKHTLWLLLLFCCRLASAQTGSEIYLFDLKEKKGAITLSKPVNITNHVGYDNQPSFHSEKPLVYYTSFNEEGRADLKSYNYKTKATANVTLTPEREYSPTLTPDRQYLSCIIQRDNGAQDLGKYPVLGGEPIVLVDNLTVGYHAWVDNSHLALFVLGEGNAPSTLHYVRLPTRKDTVLADNIGRSLHKVPHEQAFSYVAKKQDAWEIRKFNTVSLTSELIAPALPNREDITWTPAGTLLSSDGTELYVWIEKEWRKITIKNSPATLKGITRLAVNTKGDKIAVVVSE
jgi:hypothetical protein